MTATIVATPIKLTAPGTSLTMTVHTAAMATVGQFPEMIFTGVAEPSGEFVSVALPKSSADRQLQRLGLTMEGAAGQYLVFSRDPNASAPSKPYWGIKLAEGSAPAPAKRAAPPKTMANSASNRTAPQGINLGGPIKGLDEPEPEPPEDAAIAEPVKVNPAREKLIASFKLYDACFDHAVKVAGRLPDGFDAEADRGPVIASIAATLFIQANK